MPRVGRRSDVRFGSLADKVTSPRNVRFTPNHGRWAAHPSQHLADGCAFHVSSACLKERDVLRVQLAPQRAFIRIHIRDAISVTSVLRFRQDYLLQVVQF